MSTADIRMRGFTKRTPIKTLLSLIKVHSQRLSAEEILIVIHADGSWHRILILLQMSQTLIVQPWTVMHWMPNQLLVHLLTIH